MVIQQEYVYDAVVLGAGGAGLRAALELSGSGYSVAVISKVFPTRSHTVSAQGGIAATLENVSEDDWRWHMYDTIRGANYLADQAAVEYMCQQAPRAVIELEHAGLPFTRLENGTIYQRQFGGHTKHFGKELANRSCAAADRTGHALLHTLYQQNIACRTRFYTEWYGIDLVRSSEGGVVGIVALCMQTGELAFFKARAVVLATGGAGRIYTHTTNAYINTGDGLGMVLRAGYPTQDMEFWQFHPTGLAGVGCLISESVRGETGYLVNSEGERFMERYSPEHKDLDCRDVVARSCAMEILAHRGCGPQKDYVLLRIDHLDEKIIHERLPGITELAKRFAGVDPAHQPIPVVPTNHYQMGGIPTTIHGQALTLDSNGQDSVIQGLFAAGECACVSVHGANRLGTNSLLDLVVFGRAIGLHLKHALKNDLPFQNADSSEMDRVYEHIHKIENKKCTENMTLLRREMKKIMQDYFGVFRNGSDMAKGLKQLQELRQRADSVGLTDHSRIFNCARIETLEFKNLIEVALSTAVSAMQREESRGAHTRYDYPKRDNLNWLKHTVYFADGRIAFRPVDFSPVHTAAFRPPEEGN